LLASNALVYHYILLIKAISECLLELILDASSIAIICEIYFVILHLKKLGKVSCEISLEFNAIPSDEIEFSPFPRAPAK